MVKEKFMVPEIGITEKINPKIELRHFSYTIIFAALGILFVSISDISSYNLAGIFIKIILKINLFKFTSIILFLIIAAIGVLVDIHKNELRNKYIMTLEKNSYATFKATMESINDTMSNFIQSVQLYRIETEGKTDPEKEKELDEMIKSVIYKIRDQSLMEEIVKEQLTKELYILRYNKEPEESDKINMPV